MQIILWRLRMNLIRKFAVVASVAFASNAGFAGEATENAAVCTSMKNQPNWFSLPAGKEEEACSCVGKHSAMMKRLEPSLSTADVIMKGYHACLSGGAISSYYSDLAYRGVVDAVGNSTAQSYASCMSTAGLSQGMRFATDSRTDTAMFAAARNECQYILNINGFLRIFQ